MNLLWLSPNGWVVSLVGAELAVPLNELGLDLESLRINLTRRDTTANSEAKFSPTFGRSGLNHPIPMYQGNWEAVERFVDLKL